MTNEFSPLQVCTLRSLAIGRVISTELTTRAVCPTRIGSPRGKQLHGASIAPARAGKSLSVRAHSVAAGVRLEAHSLQYGPLGAR